MQDLASVTDRGRPLGWRDVDRDFKLRMAKAGLSALRFHGLRHTNATLQFEAGIHPKVVQERLGQNDIGVTLDTYSHVTPRSNAMPRGGWTRCSAITRQATATAIRATSAGPRSHR